jgi:hypothetical protein
MKSELPKGWSSILIEDGLLPYDNGKKSGRDGVPNVSDIQLNQPKIGVF